MLVENLADSAAYPAQGAFLGKRVRVMFGYQRPEFKGVIVRDDAAAPGLLIIRLDDGRHVLSLECQYSLDGTGRAPSPPVIEGESSRETNEYLCYPSTPPTPGADRP